MEVRIRLQRFGKSSKGRYNYRIVAIPKSRARDSRNLEILGHYDAAKQPAVFCVDYEKLDKWVKRGAQLSATVRTLVKKSKKTVQ